MTDRVSRAFAEMPLIAVLRGITPDEIVPVADTLMQEGIRIIEVPLNSPHAFDSIARLVERCPASVAIGAGTVLTTADVERLAGTGAPLMVTPNTDPAIIDAAIEAGLEPVIGCLTPSEALTAVAHGATILKIFPAARMGAAYLNDIRAVLPPGIKLVPFGGVSKATMAEFHIAGGDGYGFGTSLYTPGRSAEAVGAAARELVAEYGRLTGERP